jgi:hypothetical protein
VPDTDSAGSMAQLLKPSEVAVRDVLSALGLHLLIDRRTVTVVDALADFVPGNGAPDENGHDDWEKDVRRCPVDAVLGSVVGGVGCWRLLTED